MPKNMGPITIIITVKGIEEIKTQKNDTKQAAEYFFHQSCKKTSTSIVMISTFWFAAYIARIVDSHYLLAYFNRLKCILARQILHFSP